MEAKKIGRLKKDEINKQVEKHAERNKTRLFAFPQTFDGEIYLHLFLEFYQMPKKTGESCELYSPC